MSKANKDVVVACCVLVLALFSFCVSAAMKTPREFIEGPGIFTWTDKHLHGSTRGHLFNQIDQTRRESPLSPAWPFLPSDSVDPGITCLPFWASVAGGVCFRRHSSRWLLSLECPVHGCDLLSLCEAVGGVDLVACFNRDCCYSLPRFYCVIFNCRSGNSVRAK